AKRRRRVTGSDFPRVPQAAVLVVAREQSAEVRPAAGGIGVTADHELLLPDALQLQPVLRAAGDVRCVGALGDETLPPGAAGLGVPPLGVIAPGFGEPQCRPWPDRPRKSGAALEQWPAGEILAVELEKV